MTLENELRSEQEINYFDVKGFKDLLPNDIQQQTKITRI